MCLNSSDVGTGNETRGCDDRPHDIDYKLLIYMTFSILTLLECLLAGYLTSLSHALRDKVSNWFSSSLILSIGLLSTLSLAYVLVLLTLSNVTYYSRWGCWVRIVQRYLSIVSCFLLVCLALDRYLSICWPLRYYSLLTFARCRNLCTACWCTPALLLLIPCIRTIQYMCQTGHTDMTFLVAYSVVYTIGALATLVFYLLVALEFRSGCCHFRTGQVAVATTESVRQKTARSALQVLMLYTILSLPHTLLPLVHRLVPDRSLVPWWLGDAGHLVYRLHLLLFLPMYAFTNAGFLACLTAWWKYLVRRLCRTDGTMQREAPTEMSMTQYSIGGTV